MVTLLKNIINNSLTDAAAIRECAMAYPESIPYVPRLRCGICGGSDPVHPLWVSLESRCMSHAVNQLI